MDIASLATAFTGIKSAKDAAEAALGVRDFVATGAALARLTDQLLQAQQSALAQNIAMAELQADLQAARQELTALKEAAHERARYSLVALSDGVFVYRLKDRQDIDESTPGSVEPTHYLCQRCFDQGIKVVLMRVEILGSTFLRCVQCRVDFSTGERVTRDPLRFGSEFG